MNHSLGLFFWLEICCLPNAFHVDAMCASSSQCCCSSGVKKQPVTSIRVWCGAARKIRMAAMSKLGTNAWQLPTGDQHSLPVASCRMRALGWCVKSDTGSTLAMYGEYQTSLKSNFQNPLLFSGILCVRRHFLTDPFSGSTNEWINWRLRFQVF